MEGDNELGLDMEVMMSVTSTNTPLRVALRRELLRLSLAEEDRAATEAATVPYWTVGPPSIQGHRAAAAVLRASADRLLEER
jgi:hypothetical protein